MVPSVEVRDDAVDVGYREGYEKGLATAQQEVLAAAQRDAQHRARVLDEEVLKARQAAREEVHAGLAERLLSLDALLRTLPAQIRERIEACEEDLVALCAEVSFELLGKAATQPEGLRWLVRRAREQMCSHVTTAVHLHPDDLVALRESAQVAGVTDELLTSPGVSWIADPEVVLGGCIVKSPEGGLDARLETRVRALAELLVRERTQRKALRHEPPQHIYESPLGQRESSL
ncbi:FliH/SctL family protein [Variovorax terrae]|uniref:Flagellar assembly protein FliH n=1 Tax=Variovorax terrae TaxID=2923278 RepID=A0A9X2ART2_9BURK|nr:FliH/SctL family protein [Variovorax terrae]MCJ0764541.1 hypothetical protein [Variovorax terrae]